MSICIVSLSDQSFFTIVTAALEAYKVDHAKHDSGDSENTLKHLATYGATVVKTLQEKRSFES
jgi:hypothetical protein